MSELNIRVTHRTEIDGRAVERTIDIETITPRPAQTGSVINLLDPQEPAARVAQPSVSRNGEALERFRKVFENTEDKQHQAVVDNTTGLMWSVESLGDPSDESEGIAHDHCVERCKQLRLLGHDDWRLPTRAELVTLIDDTRRDPAIDVDLFPRVKPRWHWTSTAVAGSPSSAWYVDFYGGYVDYGLRYGDGFALAVRRAGQ